jgi:D-alanyl-D-alanine carboxypeptidase (penicillin-binding protein 5/6)
LKKHTVALLALLILTTPFFYTRASAAPANSAKASVLVHADSGTVLFSQNADEHMLIASTTKIMTALVVLENCDPEERVEIKQEYTDTEGSSIYLKTGEVYTVRELLYGLLLASGNDAATALACYCAGSIEAFAQMMNEKAVSMGLSNTSFRNPHGLDAEGHYSTASDLASITCEALKNELFAEIVSTKVYSFGEHSYVNHNKLLWKYKGCMGVKTGYTMAAGRSLVTCAERNGMKLVCVTLSDPNDWNDHMALYDWAFSSYEYKNVIPMGEIYSVPVISGEIEKVGVTATCGVSVLVQADAELTYSFELPEFVYAGVKKGEVAGRIFVFSNGEQLTECPLVFASDAPLADGIRMTAWQRIKKLWYMTNKYGFVFGGD